MKNYNQNELHPVKIVEKGATLSFWNLPINFFTVINSFLIIYVLTVYEYGIYKLIFSLVGIFQLWLFGGIDDVILNDVIRAGREKNFKTSSRIFFEFCFFRIIFGTIIWLIFIFFAFFAKYYFSPSIVTLLQISSFFIIFISLQSIVQLFLRINLDFSSLGKYIFLEQIVKIFSLITLFFVLNLKGVIVVMFSILLGVGASTFFYLAKLFSQLKEWFKNFPKKSEIFLTKVFKTYGKWAVFTGFAANLHPNTTIWLIKFIISTEAVAIFSIAQSFISHLQSLTPVSSILRVFVPKVIADREKMKKMFFRGVKYSTFLFLVSAIAGFIFIPPFVRLVFPNYASSMPLFKIMLLTFTFAGLNNMVGAVIFSLRDQKFLFYQSILRNFLVILLTPILILSLGLTGAALAHVLILFILLLIRIQRVKDTYKGVFPRLLNLFSIDSYDRTFFKQLFSRFKEVAKIKKRL